MAPRPTHVAAFLALRAVREWYMWALIIILIAIGGLAFWTKQVFALTFWDLVVALVYACANFYAIFLFLWLLSHATVELPRRLWYLPDLETQRRYACFQAGVTGEELRIIAIPLVV